MAESVDATDLNNLSVSRKTYQMLAFRFRETQVDKNISNPEPNIISFENEIGAETQWKLS